MNLQILAQLPKTYAGLPLKMACLPNLPLFEAIRSMESPSSMPEQSGLSILLDPKAEVAMETAKAMNTDVDLREYSPLESVASGLSTAESGAGLASVWTTHSKVSDYLGVDARTLKQRMKETPDSMRRPWVNFGSVRSPQYRWRSELVDSWWMEVNQWRLSKNVEVATGLGGGTPRRTSLRPGNVRTTGRPAISSGSSSKPLQKDETGSLMEFVKSLPSRKS